MLDRLREVGFSLNDAFSAVKTEDGFIDREKLEILLGVTPVDKTAGRKLIDEMGGRIYPC